MKKGLVIGVASSVVIVALFGYVVYWAFFDMQRLPEGEFLTESVSPNGAYTIRAYVTNGGATVAYAVRGELVFNEENKKMKISTGITERILQRYNGLMKIR
ncbi:DUF5412 family protein [Planococcus faecalis]|uniref:DUF5412 family protein n=1 Tax=Planococcus faecalis TaxID=1598147 RepID=UPI0034E98496